MKTPKMNGINTMIMEEEMYMRYQRAEKKMKALKGFHSHLWIFIIITVMIFVVRFLILPRIGALPEEEGFVDWLDVNTYLVPGLWGLAVAIHGITAYRHKIKWLKDWENRKIEEYMEQEK